jgi:hypothetical protein
MYSPTPWGTYTKPRHHETTTKSLRGTSPILWPRGTVVVLLCQLYGCLVQTLAIPDDQEAWHLPIDREYAP